MVCVLKYEAITLGISKYDKDFIHLKFRFVHICTYCMTLMQDWQNKPSIKQKPNFEITSGHIDVTVAILYNLTKKPLFVKADLENVENIQILKCYLNWLNQHVVLGLDNFPCLFSFM